MDLTKLSANIEITNPNPIISTGYTMAFWIFTNSDAFSTNLLKIVYENNFMITISTQTNLFAYCFTGLDYQDIDTYMSDGTALANFVDASNTDKSDINYIKSTQITSKKWHFIRCAYSYDNLKLYIDVNFGGFAATNLQTATLKNPAYFKGSFVYPPPRRMTPSNPKLKITRLNTLANTVFIRNFVLFADYLHPNIYIHYK